MQEINLLKNQFRNQTTVWERRQRLITASLIAVIILEITAGVLLFLFKQSVDKRKGAVVERNIQTQAKLNVKQNELVPAKALQAQLKNLSRLVDSHVYWTSFFDELSKVTLKKIHYTQLQTDVAGKVYVEGRAENYSDLGKLLLGLSTSENFSNVRLLSSGPSTGEIGGLIFGIDFKIKPGLLNKHE